MKPFSIRPSITNREPIKQYLKDISRIPLLTAEQELDAAKKAKEGDQKAKELLVISNLRFVISVAKQYQNRGINLEDLINEGNSGLIEAVEKFDPNKGVRFLSYAVWWIRQAIIKSIYNEGKTIRLPINQIRNLSLVSKAIKQFEQINEREPNLEELEDLTGLPEDKLLYLLSHTDSIVSVDHPLSDDEDSNTLIDIIPNKNASDSDSELMKESYTSNINGILNLLSDRDHDILRLSYGIGVQKMFTKDIASLFGITTERIRQLRDKALSKLRGTYKNKVMTILYD